MPLKAYFVRTQPFDYLGKPCLRITFHLMAPKCTKYLHVVSVFWSVCIYSYSVHYNLREIKVLFRSVPKLGSCLIITVRTTRPEKCDIFAQHYQSQPITKSYQTHCWYFLNLQKLFQNVSSSEYFAYCLKYCIPYRQDRSDKTNKIQIRLLF